MHEGISARELQIKYQPIDNAIAALNLGKEGRRVIGKLWAFEMPMTLEHLVYECGSTYAYAGINELTKRGFVQYTHPTYTLTVELPQCRMNPHAPPSARWPVTPSIPATCHCSTTRILSAPAMTAASRTAKSGKAGTDLRLRLCVLQSLAAVR